MVSWSSPTSSTPFTLEGSDPSNHRVDHDVLEGVRGVGMELVLVADDLVAELGLALFARDELERLQQVLAGAQRHAAAGRVDDRPQARGLGGRSGPMQAACGYCLLASPFASSLMYSLEGRS